MVATCYDDAAVEFTIKLAIAINTDIKRRVVTMYSNRNSIGIYCSVFQMKNISLRVIRPC